MTNPVDERVLDVYRGSTFEYDFNLFDIAGNAFELAGFDVRFLVRRAPYGDILHNSDDDSGLTVEVIGSNVMSVEFTDELTESWQGEYFYELVVENASGQEYVGCFGPIIVYPE